MRLSEIGEKENKRRGERERGEGAKSLGSRVSAGGFNLCVL